MLNVNSGGRVSVDSSTAIVVGLCAHGLDLVRGLASLGVKVHAIASDRDAPGAHTKLAEIHFAEDLNGPKLIDAISSVVALIKEPNPVLFLTNDKMVLQVAERWESLAGKVRLSWAGCREQAAKFLHKENLPELCARAGLKYPQSVVIESHDARRCLEAAAGLALPLMVKPVRPMASFKAELVLTHDALLQHLRLYEKDLPFVVQEWIPGGVESLKFCALYLDAGRPIAHFEGRKIDSLPRGLGTTTVAERIESPEAYELTRRFFDGHQITGPVSLEFKEDPQGQLWVIEPTIFRTDYWAGCCIANGVNLPFIEFCHATGREFLQRRGSSPRVWIDLERNPLSIFSALRARPLLLLMPWRISLTYLSKGDIAPFVRLLIDWLKRLRKSVWRRLSSVRPAAHSPQGTSATSRSDAAL